MKVINFRLFLEKNNHGDVYNEFKSNDKSLLSF